MSFDLFMTNLQVCLQDNDKYQTENISYQFLTSNGY